jgi:hypothetical protein
MNKMLGPIALLAAFAPTGALAQVEGVDLNGQYQCVAACLGPPGSFAVVTQYGRDLNVINDAGIPARGWVDYPGRIWIPDANQGAIYSPDGFRIQFDRGTIWVRAPALPPPPLRR